MKPNEKKFVNALELLDDEMIMKELAIESKYGDAAVMMFENPDMYDELNRRIKALWADALDLRVI